MGASFGASFQAERDQHILASAVLCEGAEGGLPVKQPAYGSLEEGGTTLQNLSLLDPHYESLQDFNEATVFREP